MVDHVVEDEAPHPDRPRHLEHRLAAPQEAPLLLQLRVVDPLGGGAEAGHRAVEDLDQLGGGRRPGGDPALLGGGVEVEGVVAQDGGRPPWQLGDVAGEARQGHRFFVRAPRHAVLGHALEQPAGGRGLVLVRGEEGVDHRHERSPGMYFSAVR